MKVTVQREELQKRLSDIQNIVEKKNTMPILSHFLLTAGKGGSFITATDLETAFKEPISLTVTEEGRVCIPAKKLFEIVREMDGEVALETADNQWLKVKSGKSHFRLACLSADEFPVWPSMEGGDELELTSSLLLDLLDRSLYASGESDTRYVLNGLLFHLKVDGSLTVVGTDGHRLALSVKRPGFTIQDEQKVIVSRKSVSELKRFLTDDDEGKVKVKIGKNHVLFSIEGIQFLTRLIEGTYPNYEQVIPVGNERALSLERSGLTKALRRVSIMSKERSNAVKFDIEAGLVTISASNPDLGEAKDELAVEYGGETLSMAFNARYMLDSLNVMSSERVVLRLNEPLSPALLMEEGVDDYKCVIMPMRL